jgi:predicted AAA+ superfamily ATPase
MNDQIQTKITTNPLAYALEEQHEAFVARYLGVEREILKDLKETISAPQMTVITGLRRVGKSTLLAQVAKKFLKNDFYFVNFEDERLLNFQVSDFDVLHETLISLIGDKKTWIFPRITDFQRVFSTEFCRYFRFCDSISTHIPLSVS